MSDCNAQLLSHSLGPYVHLAGGKATASPSQYTIAEPSATMTKLGAKHAKMIHEALAFCVQALKWAERHTSAATAAGRALLAHNEGAQRHQEWQHCYNLEAHARGQLVHHHPHHCCADNLAHSLPRTRFTVKTSLSCLSCACFLYDPDSRSESVCNDTLTSLLLLQVVATNRTFPSDDSDIYREVR